MQRQAAFEGLSNNECRRSFLPTIKAILQSVEVDFVQVTTVSPNRKITASADAGYQLLKCILRLNSSPKKSRHAFSFSLKAQARVLPKARTRDRRDILNLHPSNPIKIQLPTYENNS
jgi:hypothetical protein